jgi:hypothetical protein
MTAADVALWMRQQLEEQEELHQVDAAWKIAETFGEQFVYNNENGNLAIAPEVLSEFEKVTRLDVVWVRADRYWRKRQAGDGPGRNAQ